MRKPIIAFLAAALILPALTTANAEEAAADPAEARAQTTPAACGLGELANELTAVRNDASLGYLEKQRAETDVRRRLLDAVIACDQNEITALTEALESLPEDAKSLPAYHRVVEGLAQAAIFYSAHKDNISRMSIQNTKAASREIAAWRESTYVPLVALADNFILWADNQEFLDRASGRLAQVSRWVASLKLVNLEDGTAAKFEDAKKRLEAAFLENESARKALNEGRGAKGLAHIQASLKALSDTYHIFLGLQEDLKSVVR